MCVFTVMGVFWGNPVVVKTSFASQGEAGTGLGSFKYTLSQLRGACVVSLCIDRGVVGIPRGG